MGQAEALLDSLELADDELGTGLNAVSLCCIIYTYEPSHWRAAAIKNTWGRGCDSLIFLSNATNEQLGTVILNHTKKWPKESYDNLWQATG